MEEEWKILSYKIKDNDVVVFTAQHIETGQKVTLEANRGGWEWGVGELLDLSVYGY